MTFEEYLLQESFTPILPMFSENRDRYKRALIFLDKVMLKNKRPTLEDSILMYQSNYEDISEIIDISRFIDLYKECSELLKEDKELTDNISYTENDFIYNGFIKSTFVIHEHDSKKAPLHWDLRFKTEFGTSAYSFVLLKHKMPEDTEKLLVKQQPMHPPQWVDMDHTQIGEGYGQGSVTTVDRGTIFYKLKNKSFTLFLMGSKFYGPYHLINLRNSMFLIFKATSSILVDKDERLEEWSEYASNFLQYLKDTFKRKFNITDIIKDTKINKNHILETNDYEINIHNQSSDDIYIPSIQMCIDIRNDKQSLEDNISKECNVKSVEDVMRLLILRDTISPKFFSYLNSNYNITLDDIYEDIRDIPYSDKILEQMKDKDFQNYKIEKVYRMFSDIYLGHKFYSQFDFERYLIKLIESSKK